MISNGLLEALAPVDRDAVLAIARRGQLRTGDLLYDPGDPVDHCYFPCGAAIASFLVVMDDGLAVETAMIGSDGALGGIVSHGQVPSYSRAVVLRGGVFLKVPLAALDALKQERPPVARLFDRFADCFLAQVFQSVACNASHTIEQRAARWLLAAIERSGGRDVAISQEQLGALLGVGRSYTSRVLQRLKALGLVTIYRGGVEVPDPAGLGAIACSCNAQVRRHYERVLGGIYGEALLPS